MPLYANDIIYGGLGNDAIHGGAGDDAISGAEALAVAYTNSYSVDKTDSATKLNTALIESDYNHPYNPGNVLGYSAALTYQAQYDPNDPFRADLAQRRRLAEQDRERLPWLLNFDPNDGPIDALLGGRSRLPDCGADGRQRHHLRRSRQRLAGRRHRARHHVRRLGQRLSQRRRRPEHRQDSLNSGPDTNPSWEDFVYGGAGLDVMLANTAGDRLIDWGGEFNSYLVPFDPFGMPTISRNPSPNSQDLLYAFAKSSGADQLLAGDLLERSDARTASRSASSGSSSTWMPRGATSTAARATRSRVTSTTIATFIARQRAADRLGSGHHARPDPAAGCASGHARPR